MEYKLLVKTISSDVFTMSFKKKEQAQEFIDKCIEPNGMISVSANECDIFIRPKYIESIRLYKEKEE